MAGNVDKITGADKDTVVKATGDKENPSRG